MRSVVFDIGFSPVVPTLYKPGSKIAVRFFGAGPMFFHVTAPLIWIPPIVWFQGFDVALPESPPI